MTVFGKRYKIVNKVRFVAFLTILFILCSFISVGILGLSSARAAEDITYLEVEVCEGDTLWGLAKRYGDPDKDIRDVVYEISRINNVKAQDLRAGQVILIPEYDHL